MLVHKRPLTLSAPGSDSKIGLEEECVHCKGTNVDQTAGEGPCPECALGYQLTHEGETLIQLVHLHRRHILPEIDVLAEFTNRFRVRR